MVSSEGTPTSMVRYDDSPTGPRCGLPVTEFLYTLDQVAHVLSLRLEYVKPLVWFTGLVGYRDEDYPGFRPMQAIHILPSDLHDKPEWRIPESELVRYLEWKQYTIYEKRIED